MWNLLLIQIYKNLQFFLNIPDDIMVSMHTLDLVSDIQTQQVWERTLQLKIVLKKTLLVKGNLYGRYYPILSALEVVVAVFK